MVINHETAMFLWNKRYGKETRVIDFAGREMEKGSYGNRNSEYGWNLDHILPQTNGGKDTEWNLICCNIKTNDEKANKYPAFKAKGQSFEIVKVQNHYEIKAKDNTNNVTRKNEVNFFDYSSALSFFKKCEKNKYWIGTIHIRLNNLSNPAVLDFVKEILSDYEVEIYECKNQITNLIYSSNTKSYEIVVYIPDVNTIDFTQRILDDCILVNTYLKYYFLERKYFASYFIVDSLYQVDYNVGLYNFDEPDDVKALINQNNSKNCLVINDLVKINTEADEENVDKFCCYRNVTYWKYDYSYNNLRENLLKIED